MQERLIKVITKFSDDTYDNKPDDVKLIMGEDFGGLAEAILKQAIDDMLKKLDEPTIV